MSLMISLNHFAVPEKLDSGRLAGTRHVADRLYITHELKCVVWTRFIIDKPGKPYDVVTTNYSIVIAICVAVVLYTISPDKNDPTSFVVVQLFTIGEWLIATRIKRYRFINVKIRSMCTVDEETKLN